MKKIIMLGIAVLTVAVGLSGCAGQIQNIKQAKKVKQVNIKDTISAGVVNNRQVAVINKYVAEKKRFTVQDLRLLILNWAVVNKDGTITGASDKKLALLVEKILKTYPNVYKNINGQGRRYRTALYIAASRGFVRTVYILLTDKNINPGISSLTRKKAEPADQGDGPAGWLYLPGGTCKYTGGLSGLYQVVPIAIFYDRFGNQKLFTAVQQKLWSMTNSNICQINNSIY